MGLNKNEGHVALGYIDLLKKAHNHHQQGLEKISGQLGRVKDRMSLINYVLDNLDALTEEVFEGQQETEASLKNLRHELKELALQFRRSQEENKFHISDDDNPIDEETLRKCEEDDDLTLTEDEVLRIKDKLSVWKDTEANAPKELAEKQAQLSSEYLTMTVTATGVRINADNETIVSKQTRGTATG